MKDTAVHTVNESIVYLTETSNRILTEQINNGEIIRGILRVNPVLHELTFSFFNCIAFQYNEITVDADEIISFSDGYSYYTFATTEPETIRAVN